MRLGDHGTTFCEDPPDRGAARSSSRIKAGQDRLRARVQALTYEPFTYGKDLVCHLRACLRRLGVGPPGQRMQAFWSVAFKTAVQGAYPAGGHPEVVGGFGLGHAALDDRQDDSSITRITHDPPSHRPERSRGTPPEQCPETPHRHHNRNDVLKPDIPGVVHEVGGVPRREDHWGRWWVGVHARAACAGAQQCEPAT